mmetsp:Transcript_12584/g.22272  ORF Transcript_12584/g.22272 Transcript_12584/m.22272 type:complete len:209 (-) Transcript_12584:673-1299(-)|eukprot:CAMPEP_0119108694 /NCGR_PEP_ID=MMETSP1180-20130426/15605_1 /TAXON_ID=3052 ORGANISM="Chlamydomonas cf sp, Strain CCMP681" /NCGR_SAMPLE_ID=MMETSP1180 /ASSEMBLY_ACC=CAM_ASM_000741 /LENGTH=208 /DNA_ID=CAMNT_0007094339 /DNA_START=78 /DNA_END=704 /DNA_ORIENTATION=-
MPTHNAMTATLTGVTLPQNPSYTHTYRDFSSTHSSHVAHQDIFRTSDNPQPTPWVTEHRIQLQAPDKYSQRVLNMTLVGTGGATDMAWTTHHTVRASPNGTIYKGLDKDQAFEEEVQVAQEVQSAMPAVVAACEGYQLHCDMDGWITTTGFVVCARKAGLSLDRAQFLALERAVPKDTLGRINFYQVTEAVQRLASGGSPSATGRSSF